MPHIPYKLTNGMICTEGVRVAGLRKWEHCDCNLMHQMSCICYALLIELIEHAGLRIKKEKLQRPYSNLN